MKILNMQAVILCAGFGARLRPIIDKVPKVMAPIDGRPLLLRQIEHFKHYGVKDFLINLHYLPEVITNYFGDGSRLGVRITYSQEKEILGTAGGLKKFEPYLDDCFFLLYGDVFNNINYSALLDYYRKKQPCLGVHVIAKTDHALDSDLVSVNSEMRFQKIYQKPHKELPKENYYDMQGIYVLNKKILDHIPANKYYEIDHQLLPDVLDRGGAYHGYLVGVEDYVHDIGTPDRYRNTKSLNS